VYLVQGSRGSVVLKQGRLWVRICPDRPMTPADPAASYLELAG
jgi:ribosomal protein L16/L10AE